MKVRIKYTVDVDDDTRRAIAHHFGLPGLADRDEVRSFFREQGLGNGGIILGDEADIVDAEIIDADGGGS